eukprot:3227173-Prymnesium_polylepis.1
MLAARPTPSRLRRSPPTAAAHANLPRAGREARVGSDLAVPRATCPPRSAPLLLQLLPAHHRDVSGELPPACLAAV